MNLISNSVKYTKKGFIKIKVKDSQNLINGPQLIDIEVSDSGMGMSLEI